MFEIVIASLDRVGSLVFWTCTIMLVTIDVAAVAAVIGTKSRELVNRWTGAVLAANLLLIGAGVAVPGAAYFARQVLRTMAPATQSPVLHQDANPKDR